MKVNYMQTVKTALLIIILAEEIKRACNKDTFGLINLDQINLNHHLQETVERIL